MERTITAPKHFDSHGMCTGAARGLEQPERVEIPTKAAVFFSARPPLGFPEFLLGVGLAGGRLEDSSSATAGLTSRGIAFSVPV